MKHIEDIFLGVSNDQRVSHSAISKMSLGDLRRQKALWCLWGGQDPNVRIFLYKWFLLPARTEKPAHLWGGHRVGWWEDQGSIVFWQPGSWNRYYFPKMVSIASPIPPLSSDVALQHPNKDWDPILFSYVTRRILAVSALVFAWYSSGYAFKGCSIPEPSSLPVRNLNFVDRQCVNSMHLLGLTLQPSSSLAGYTSEQAPDDSSLRLFKSSFPSPWTLWSRDRPCPWCSD